MNERVTAWAAATGRVTAAASGLAVLMLASGFTDYPLNLPQTGFLLILAAGVATFAAHWHVPARALYFVGPVIVLGLAFTLAEASLIASFDLAGVNGPEDGLVLVRLFPQLLVMIPGALAGTAAAAVTFEK